MPPAAPEYCPRPSPGADRPLRHRRDCRGTWPGLPAAFHNDEYQAFGIRSQSSYLRSDGFSEELIFFLTNYRIKREVLSFKPVREFVNIIL